MQIDVFKFKNINCLYSDINGNFFFNEKPIKKHWRKGQIFIIINKKQIGMKTLRKITYKSKINIEELPF